MWKWLWNCVKDRGQKNFEERDRKGLDCLEQRICQNTDIKGATSDGLEGIEECC